MKRTLLSLLTVLALTTVTFSQNWVPKGLGWATASRGVQNISLVNQNVVWAAAYDGSGGGAACQDVSVSSNGGNTWTPKVINGATGLTSSMITAVDANKAWAAMYKVSGTTLQGIYYTADGGATWTRQGTSTMFANSASFPNIVYFWDANNGMTMGDPVSGDFEIYTTTNGGTTWTQTPAANIPNAISGEYGYTSDLSVVGNTLWFGTNKGHIYKTTDKGLTWTVASPAGMTGKNLTPCFKDQTMGFSLKFYSAADTINLLTKSVDGGATYTAFTYAGPVFNQMLAFVPGTANTFVSAGVDGTYPERVGLTYSFDGGSTWVGDGELAGTQITHTAWLNDSTAFAGSFNGDATDGIFKFNSHLIGPTPAFTASDTAIELGGTVHFTNESTAGTSYKWTFQGGTPGSSTLQTPPPIVYATAGAHDVTLKVTNSWGSATLVKSGYIYVGGMGLGELAASSVNVYPNPVKDVMNVVSNTNNIEEITLFNMMGQTVFTQKFDGKNINVNVATLKAGVYSMKVKMAEGFVNKKVVIN